MKLLVDMNLSPRWTRFLSDAGIEAAHWSEVGAGNAPDTEIMAFAKAHDYVVLTHDLDFRPFLRRRAAISRAWCRSAPRT
jgi:predicted nuclease of predicted toxin-antitoxin system